MARTAATLSLVAALLAGCGSRPPGPSSLAPSTSVLIADGTKVMGRATGGAEGGAPGEARALAPAAYADGKADVAGSADGSLVSDQVGSGLKGGELDDNSEFERYLAYLASYRAPNVLRIDVTGRQVWQVVDSAGKPVHGASVQVSGGGGEVASLKSASDGRVLVFAPPDLASAPLAVRVRKGDLALDATLAASRSATLALPGPRQAVPAKLDIAFVLDVTGSMNDELARIQQTIGDISARIKSLPAAPVIRYGLVAFRDRTDDWVTRKQDFTPDLAEFKARLVELSAVGGGDYPESVQEALHDAVNDLSWDAGDSLRLMFLVGDAPPHLDYAQDYPYPAELRKAAGVGIKIFPVAASGLDNQGEYVFRQFAQITGGKFLYITYGGDTPLHVGPVQENNLDDLVVGIVRSELANLD